MANAPADQKPPILILEHERVALFHGDSALLDLPENSVDAIVCDPPAAIAFMGRTWDDDRGGYDGWTTWLARVLAPGVRALKPGGWALLWALPRTSHWTARAVELAGLEIRDVHHDVIAADEVLQDFLAMLDERQAVAFARLIECVGAPIVYQLFGSGFPKSLDISKAIDAAAGAARQVTGQARGHVPTEGGVHDDDNYQWKPIYDRRDLAATSEAARWTGYGTALKPAIEHWILARKPLEGTYADNVLTHGTGALNIDACRIGTEMRVNAPAGNKGGTAAYNMGVRGMPQDAESRVATGRWPAHLSLRHAPDCEIVGTTTEEVAAYENVGEVDRDGNGTNFAMGKQRPGAKATIERETYRCAPGCPVAELDAQSGTLKSNARRAGVRQGHRSGTVYAAGHRGDGGPALTASEGGASRFFYTPKPSRREKDAGLVHLKPSTGGEATDREDGSAGLQSPRAGAGRTGGAKNSHPTVKSIELMKWLIRLVVPDPATLGRPGIVLDPFAGSGSTGVAALALGHDFIGSELTDEYLPALLGRIQHALAGGK